PEKDDGEPARALLVRALLRLPRHAPGRRQGLGRLLLDDQEEVPADAVARWLLGGTERLRLGWAGLPDGDCGHRPVGADQLPADLPAVSAGTVGQVAEPDRS